MQSAFIIYPVVSAAVLILSLCFLPKSWKLKLTSCLNRSREPQSSILPATEQRGPRPTFSARHIAHLRDWQKPDVVPFIHLQHHARAPVKATDIPTLTPPSNVYQPPRVHKMTWQQFQDRQRNRDPNADEYHRHVRMSWKPSPPRNYEYWKKVGEDMEAGKGWWEKAKDKFHKHYPQKDREIVFH